jgi:hypothetical protein
MYRSLITLVNSKNSSIVSLDKAGALVAFERRRI